VARSSLLEHSDLAGMIEIVLSDADKLRVRGIGRLGHQRLIEFRRRESANRFLQFFIRPPQRAQRVPPF
jgi:hypothetical protein